MKYVSTLIIFTLFIQKGIIAQDTYDFILNNNSRHSSINLNLIPLKDKSYIIGKTYLSTVTFRNGLDIIKLDSLDNVIYTQNYELDLGTVIMDRLGTLVPTKDGGCALGAPCFKGNYNFDIQIIKFDSLGNYQWAYDYGTSDRESTNTICHTLDNGYIISGLTMSQNNGDAYFIKVDSVGILEWTQYYGEEGYFDRSLSIAIDTVNGGGYIAGGSTKLAGNPSSKKNAFMLKLDEQGNILWDKYYENDYIDNCDLNVQAYPTGGYIIWGCELKFMGVRKFLRYYLARLDSATNTLWETELQTDYTHDTFEFVSNVRILKDGSMIAVGYKQAFEGDYAWIAKYNSEGETLWERIYDHNEILYSYVTYWPSENTPNDTLYHQCHSKREHFYDIAETLDGGLIVSGSVEIPDSTGKERPCTGFPVKEVWILKLDSMGCLTPNCGAQVFVGTEEEATKPSLPTPQLHIYPNPTKHQSTLSLSALPPSISQAELRVYHISGQLVHQQNIANPSSFQNLAIHTSNWQSGIYLCSIVANGKVIAREKLVVW